MEIKHDDDGKKGSFKVLDNDKVAGKMTYTWVDSTKFIIDHTEVDSAYNGKGLGKQMLSKAVDFAREKDLKIIPLCPFVKSVFEKSGEYDDVKIVKFG